MSKSSRVSRNSLPQLPCCAGHVRIGLGNLPCASPPGLRTLQAEVCDSGPRKPVSVLTVLVTSLIRAFTRLPHLALMPLGRLSRAVGDCQVEGCACAGDAVECRQQGGEPRGHTATAEPLRPRQCTRPRLQGATRAGCWSSLSTEGARNPALVGPEAYENPSHLGFKGKESQLYHWSHLSGLTEAVGHMALAWPQTHQNSTVFC